MKTYLTHRVAILVLLIVALFGAAFQVRAFDPGHAAACGFNSRTATGAYYSKAILQGYGGCVAAAQTTFANPGNYGFVFANAHLNSTTQNLSNAGCIQTQWNGGCTTYSASYPPGGLSAQADWEGQGGLYSSEYTAYYTNL